MRLSLPFSIFLSAFSLLTLLACSGTVATPDEEPPATGGSGSSPDDDPKATGGSGLIQNKDTSCRGLEGLYEVRSSETRYANMSPWIRLVEQEGECTAEVSEMWQEPVSSTINWEPGLLVISTPTDGGAPGSNPLENSLRTEWAWRSFSLGLSVDDELTGTGSATYWYDELDLDVGSSGEDEISIDVTAPTGPIPVRARTNVLPWEMLWFSPARPSSNFISVLPTDIVASWSEVTPWDFEGLLSVDWDEVRGTTLTLALTGPAVDDEGLPLAPLPPVQVTEIGEAQSFLAASDLLRDSEFQSLFPSDSGEESAPACSQNGCVKIAPWCGGDGDILAFQLDTTGATSAVVRFAVPLGVDPGVYVDGPPVYGGSLSVQAWTSEGDQLATVMPVLGPESETFSYTFDVSDQSRLGVRVYRRMPSCGYPQDEVLLIDAAAL